MRYRSLVIALVIPVAIGAAEARRAARTHVPASAAAIDRAAFATDAEAFAALQAAVDQGGIVFVEGSFALPRGTPLWVGRHGHDVKIEAGDSGATLDGVNIEQVRDAATGLGVSMTVKRLHLVRSLGTYVNVEATTGTTIWGCVMEELASPGIGAVGVRVRKLTGQDGGRVEISHNEIDAGDAYFSITGALNVGIYVNMSAAPSLEVEIAGNVVTRAQTAGIFVNCSLGDYVIEENQVTAVGSNGVQGYPWAAGIWGRAGAEAACLGEILGPTRFVVAGNVVDVTNGVLGIGYGNFRIPSAEVLVRDNDIRVTNGSFTMMGIHGDLDDSAWLDNRITGTARTVVAMISKGYSGAEGNLFAGNQIDVGLIDIAPHPFFKLSRADFPMVDLFFSEDANHNVAIDFADLTWDDRGIGNVIE